ncbi:MAG: restriction endonuclease, partial [Proteobacteria bacterium]|nr:restriction endonuclease [Pseudomonadota bacterium]
MTWESLRIALRGLKATGQRGFEGFVAEALTEITGWRFRLLKPGPQGGLDGRADASASGLTVGFEAKHYDAKTALSLGALKTKVEEAAGSAHDLELWVLATTRAIDAGDARQLIAHGHERGIEVLVLDWGDPVAVPPALALMCAMAPTVFARWFPGSTDALRTL